MARQTAQSQNFAETRTAAQRAATEHVSGDLLVSAAAGSGKTTVLADRCARLVCDLSPEQGGCGVDDLLVLTFTDAAAGEMRTRIARAIRQKMDLPGDRERTRWLRRQSAMVDRAGISTLHAFCARVLRQHFHEARIDPAFEVMDEDEARLLRDEVLTELFARWHKPTIALRGNARPLNAEDFSAFFEAYGQGRESTCREMILAVHRMLASTADPAAYLTAARAVYSEAGREETVARYFTQTVTAQIRLAMLVTRRACADVQDRLKSCPMLIALHDALGRLDEVQRCIERKDVVAARAALEDLWPKQLKSMKEFADFQEIKERSYEPIKKLLREKLRDDYLATDAGELLADLAGLARPLETLLGLTGDFASAFAAAKRALNRLDFADLERLTLDLLKMPGSLAAAELRGRYRYVLVDEFQDINPLQAALLEAVRSPEGEGESRGNLFVVGDVKQSIYAFRLAEPKLFLKLEQVSRAATTAAVRRHVFLPHNFRSHPTLLLAMNAFFERLLTLEVAQINYSDGHALEPPPALPDAGATSDADPSLLAGSPVEVHLVVTKRDEESAAATSEDDAPEIAEGGESGQPAVEDLSSVEEEARMVAARIAALKEERRTIRTKDGATEPLRYRDIAILLRSMKDKAMIFARALARRGIPVHADLSTGYFDTPEVQAALSLLQVLDNPRQDIPLASALLGPYGRFSHDDIATIRLSYDRKQVSFPDAVMRYAQDRGRIEALADTARDPPPFSAELAARLDIFLAKIAGWRQRLHTRPLHEGLAEIFADSKILPYLAGLEAGAQRALNLQALHQWALKFSAFSKQGLHRFLRFIERLREQEADIGEAPVLSEASDVVRVMSIHKSKGLEFPVVFVSGLGNKLNLLDKGPVYVHRDLGIGLKVADVERNVFYHSAASRNIVDANDRSGRAEELRLLYVAMTRARDHLILTGHINKAQALAQKRSQWQTHAAALPEDVLLKGRTALDWLLPTLACCGLRTRWPEDSAMENAQVTIALHPAVGGAAGETSPADADAAQDEIIRRLLAAEPLSPAAGEDPAIVRLTNRVTGVYLHEELSSQPAVVSVSQLKTRAGERAPDPEDEWEAPEMIDVPAGGEGGGRRAGEEARLRGIATHRILEVLDLTLCSSAEAIAEQIRQLVVSKRLSADEERRADVAGIIWCLTASPAGRRLVDAAGRQRAGTGAIHLRREIPFNWAAPPETLGASPDPADWPTIRGVIDVLLVEGNTQEAEIFDYKTDSLFTWQNNTAEYQRQMRYYLRAASEILGAPVSRATLLFLAAHQEVEVRAP